MDDVYIGIDPSYTGLAISVLRGAAEHTTYLDAFPKEKYGDGVDRLIAIRSHINGVITTWAMRARIKHICIEGYAHGRINGREIAGELGASVKQSIHYALAGQVRYPTIVPPATLKLFATGKGTSPKNVVLLRVYQKWGVEFTDDNKADAYVLACIARALEGHEPVEFDYERKAIKALTPHTESHSLTRP